MIYYIIKKLIQIYYYKQSKSTTIFWIARCPNINKSHCTWKMKNVFSLVKRYRTGIYFGIFTIVDIKYR